MLKEFSLNSAEFRERITNHININLRVLITHLCPNISLIAVVGRYGWVIDSFLNCGYEFQYISYNQKKTVLKKEIRYF